MQVAAPAGYLETSLKGSHRRSEAEAYLRTSLRSRHTRRAEAVCLEGERVPEAVRTTPSTQRAGGTEVESPPVPSPSCCPEPLSSPPRVTATMALSSS